MLFKKCIKNIKNWWKFRKLKQVFKLWTSQEEYIDFIGKIEEYNADSTQVDGLMHAAIHLKRTSSLKRIYLYNFVGLSHIVNPIVDHIMWRATQRRCVESPNITMFKEPLR